MRKTASYYHEQAMNLLEVLDDHEEKTGSALTYGLGEQHLVAGVVTYQVTLQGAGLSEP